METKTGGYCAHCLKTTKECECPNRPFIAKRFPPPIPIEQIEKRWKTGKEFTEEQRKGREEAKRLFNEMFFKVRAEQVNDFLLGPDSNRAWDVHDIIAKLVEATDILLDQKNYDGHGWEQIHHCREKAREILKRLKP